MRRHLLNALMTTVLLLGSSAAAHAAIQTIPLPVTINGVAKGEVPAAIIGDDVLLKTADLQQLGIVGPAWERLLALSRVAAAPQQIDGMEAVSLNSLSPLLNYTIDQENLSLALNTDPRLLAATTVSIRNPRPADITYAHDRSAFLNYSVSSPSLKGATVFGEVGTTFAKGLLYSSFTRPLHGAVIRGLTNFTLDEPQRLRRWTAGDAFVATDTLGGGGLIEGLTVSRNFNLDPYFIRFPSMNLVGTALTPSRVDVYVNGILIGEQEVPPGPFELRNVQVSPGAGSMQLVVRDAFGRERVSSTDYYFSTNVLARGLSEYVYSAGVLREDFGVRSFATGDPAAVAFHRVGVTDALTVGGRAEASRGLLSAGPVTSFRTSFGDFGLSVAGSTDHGRHGAATETSYRYLARRFSFGGQVRSLSRDYATLALRTAADRPTLQTTAFASYSNRLGSLGVQWDALRMRDSEDQRRVSLLASFPVGSRTAVLASAASVTQGGSRHGEYFVGASFRLGPATTASASLGRIGNRDQSIFEVDRSLPVGTGFGYRVQSIVDDSGTTTNAASVQYQTAFGRYEISGDPSHSNTRPTVTASGGVVVAGGVVQLSEPVLDSFALVRVGVPRVRVYASNQLVGRTDRNGDLLVPNLLSYYGNPIRIEDKDIPMAYQVGAVERTIAPPYRGGAIVTFPVQEHRSVVGILEVVTEGRRSSPALGTLTVSNASNKWDSPIGRGGEFDLEDLPAGSYDAVVDFRGGTCRFVLKVPEDAGIVNLGTLTCTGR